MGLGGPGCKLVRGETAKARMRPVMVVIDPPSLDDLSGGAQAAEQVLVEAFVAEATVEALHEAILHRFTWSDVVPFHGVILLPLQGDCRESCVWGHSEAAGGGLWRSRRAR